MRHLQLFFPAPIQHVDKQSVNMRKIFLRNWAAMGAASIRDVGYATAKIFAAQGAPARGSEPAILNALACRFRSRMTMVTNCRLATQLKPAFAARRCSQATTKSGEANDTAFRNGWFRTGHLGHMDERWLSQNCRPSLGLEYYEGRTIIA